MGLNMSGHVSGPFLTHTPELRRYSSQIINHKPVFALEYFEPSFAANIQQASDKEIEFLNIGGERVNDVRVVHRNDGRSILVSTPDHLADILVFSDGVTEATWWKSINTDFRPWHNFCRATVVKLDQQEIDNLKAKGAI
jgi:hypothetical protein